MSSEQPTASSTAHPEPMPSCSSVPHAEAQSAINECVLPVCSVSEETPLSPNISNSSVHDDEMLDELLEYRIPDPKPSILEVTPFQRKLEELHTIFTVNGVTLKGQSSILKFIRTLDPTWIHQFPLDGRTLRPPKIPFIERNCEPNGKVYYFGIESVLAFEGINLFDRSCTEIRLTVNVDGLPIYRMANGIGFWPIVGSIDQFPVFLIGLHEGRSKPTCPNDYLKDFIEECTELCTKGISIDNVVYRFKLEKLSMDAVALSYITGVKGHSGYYGCSKCTDEGTCVIVGMNKTGRLTKQVRFLNMDAPPRTNADFRNHYDWSSDPHLPDTVHQSTLSDEEDGPNESVLVPSLEKEVKGHHQHVTALVTIPGFDLVRDIPLDYMHLVLEGVTKRLLQCWLTPGQYAIKAELQTIISERLVALQPYTPCEFQRKPDSLTHLSSWKATQYRAFLLYTGCFVLQNHLDESLYHHFLILSFCMRLLTRHIDRDENRTILLQKRGDFVQPWLRYFVKQGCTLYTNKFAVYNVHNLIHVVDDYKRFGPLDEYSAFRFESFLGRIKQLVKSHYKPAMQVVNRYSSLLTTRSFATEGSRHIGPLDEYFELPALLRPLPDDLEDCPERGRPSNEHDCYERFAMMRFKKFTLRTDSLADCYCVVENHYAKVTKILRSLQSGQIYITIRYFEHTENLFTIPIMKTTSRNVGIIIGSHLTTRTYLKHYSKISDKCFAFPYNSIIEGKMDGLEKWALLRLLH